MLRTRWFIKSVGTAFPQDASASGPRSLLSPSKPASFSTCIMMTVCWGSTSLIWRMSARKALASAAIASSQSGVIDPMPPPPPNPRAPVWLGPPLHDGEPLGIRLDPMRHVIGGAVLPRGEPDQNQSHVPLAGLCDLGVHEGELELAFFRLNQFPTDGADDGIEVQGRELVPNRFHVLGARCARVVQLASEHDERLAVHVHLLHAAVLFDLRQRQPAA